MIRVFIQAAAGSAEKHLHDEVTLAPAGVLTLALPYPFPYGFVPGTRAEDGDCVDCYVLTARPLAVGEIVECEPIGLLEQLEDGAADHKVLAVLAADPAAADPAAADPAAAAAAVAAPDPAAVAALRAFIAGVFAPFPEIRFELGRLLGADAARAHLGRAVAGP